MEKGYFDLKAICFVSFKAVIGLSSWECSSLLLANSCSSFRSHLESCLFREPLFRLGYASSDLDLTYSPSWQCHFWNSSPLYFWKVVDRFFCTRLIEIILNLLEKLIEKSSISTLFLLALSSHCLEQKKKKQKNKKKIPQFGRFTFFF